MPERRRKTRWKRCARGAGDGQEAQQQQNQAGQNDSDPLGRARGNQHHGSQDSRDGRPSEVTRHLEGIAQARGGAWRPQQELDYYDRLLKEF